MSPRKLDPGSAVVASIVSGSVAGSSTVLVFTIWNSLNDEWSVGLLAQVVSGTVLAGFVGAIIAVLPGVAIGLFLQRFKITRAAAIVGSIIGAMLLLVIFLTLANQPVTASGPAVLAGTTFALCGAVGGGAGGLTLAHYGKQSDPTKVACRE